MPQPQQRQIRATYVTYTTAHGNTGSLTHWVSSGIEPASSRILVRFISAEPQRKLPRLCFLKDGNSKAAVYTLKQIKSLGPGSLLQVSCMASRQMRRTLERKKRQFHPGSWEPVFPVILSLAQQVSHQPVIIWAYRGAGIENQELWKSSAFDSGKHFSNDTITSLSLFKEFMS